MLVGVGGEEEVAVPRLLDNLEQAGLVDGKVLENEHMHNRLDQGAQITRV